MIMPKVKDQHTKFKVLYHFANNMQSMLTRMMHSMGQALFFNFWNPTGVYDLNLSMPEQRTVAKTLILINKQFYAKVKAGECKDRSQKGNLSCLRNEKVSGGNFIWTPDYVLPDYGNFQCSFIYLAPNRPNKADQLPDQEMVLLMAWFKDRYDAFVAECEEVNTKLRFDGEAFADAFAAISDYLCLSTAQLLNFMDIIDGKFAYVSLAALNSLIFCRR